LTTAQNELATQETDELPGLPAVEDDRSIFMAEDQANGDATGVVDCAAAPAAAARPAPRIKPIIARRRRVR
jgi:hypothetical protein